MYLTMNRFRVRRGQEAVFEAVWTGRDSQLPAVRGFVAFHLMKGPEAATFTLYASHTLWETEDAFRAWSRSEAFRTAHRGAGALADICLEPPVLECFTAVQTIGRAAPEDAAGRVSG
ncbi:MAG: antibiotic biosynthesis monooxygenase [Rhodobacteraceae bacterium]|jgi:heme-degrading monooxygenase HmoA|nr:antibiotic biosynthesis monooxygenase [Paracoccaceae bacterium]